MRMWMEQIKRVHWAKLNFQDKDSLGWILTSLIVEEKMNRESGEWKGDNRGELDEF